MIGLRGKPVSAGPAMLPADPRGRQRGSDCESCIREYGPTNDLMKDGGGQIVCLGTTTPAGLVPGGYDEDDTDPTVIETEDFDDLLDLIR
jgi:hypothetical protein